MVDLQKSLAGEKQVGYESVKAEDTPRSLWGLQGAQI